MRESRPGREGRPPLGPECRRVSGGADVAEAEGVGTEEKEACVGTGGARDERFVGEAGT